MFVRKRTELKYSLNLSLGEAETAKKISKKAGCTVEALIENVLDSGLCSAADAIASDNFPVGQGEIDDDGNVIGSQCQPE